MHNEAMTTDPDEVHIVSSVKVLGTDIYVDSRGHLRVSTMIRDNDTGRVLNVPGELRLVCPNCRDTGHVCENHSDRVWGYECCATIVDDRCEHGGCVCGAGMPCPTCCTPIPEDGAHTIGEAFTPNWQRDRP